MYWVCVTQTDIQINRSRGTGSYNFVVCGSEVFEVTLSKGILEEASSPQRLLLNLYL